jgi:hypothetical protein
MGSPKVIVPHGLPSAAAGCRENRWVTWSVLATRLAELEESVVALLERLLAKDTARNTHGRKNVNLACDV